ncbi:putative molybdopterin biosynthesis protein [Symbiobacterium terraclitae]|uniref:Molybdopterin molybdenumtransferase n=1 Tax=Symbiobacterium terraclitae TaxID=557451 RepID=A0ABS4JNI3_9FIRM|nr:molybdopterin biosynthesis protein [Symbiobacterium terraclitae]MBP2017093.1 putative molybdopterin biosynthesis protein [Symbiobacterium terraclitae]
MSKRQIYLESLPHDVALERLLTALDQAGWGPQREVVPTDKALGRITAAPVRARISAPHYNASAVDGIAVKASDTFGATETSPLTLTIGEQAHWVDTGDPLPPGCDAVIMVEHVNLLDDGHHSGARCEILAPVAPWQDVRQIGEDVVATEILLPEGHTIRPQDMGALLAAGILEVPVVRKPVVTFIPTGTEIVEPKADPAPGEIIEFNSRVILSMVSEWGGTPVRGPIVRDDYDLIRRTVREAVAGSDIVIVNAGSSAGSEDYTVHVLKELGQVLAHGVAIRPGKPVMLGLIDGKPFVGLPGYPVSTWLTAELFVKPLVYRFLGQQVPRRPTVRASLARRVTSPMGVTEYVRVKLGRVGERLVATPISRGAAVISSLVRADGLLVVPSGLEGIGEGSEVEVELLRPLSEIQETVVAIGSHDTSLDLMGSFLRRKSGFYLSSAHVGSQGGLLALKRGEAHVAGVHLLDEATGDYNTAYVQKYLGRPALLVLLARREQGFIVPRGNPKNITSFRDLARPDVQYVNRQRGAGTRLLLDYHLKQEGISPAEVQGYRWELFTHLNVAAAVKAGDADAGLGIRSAAQAMDLDFVPVAWEEYELCIPAELEEHPGVQAVLTLLRDPEFLGAVESLGGYDCADSGRIRRV